MRFHISWGFVLAVLAGSLWNWADFMKVSGPMGKTLSFPFELEIVDIKSNTLAVLVFFMIEMMILNLFEK